MPVAGNVDAAAHPDLVVALDVVHEPRKRVGAASCRLLHVAGVKLMIHYRSSRDEALALANDTPFGLAAGIATTSLKHATHFKRHSQAGMVMVNLPTAGVDYHVPFGGRKGTSYGPREQGRYAAEFFTSVKTSYVLA